MEQNNGNYTNYGPSLLLTEQGNTLSDELRRYAGLLWHWAWLLILLTLIAGISAYIFSSRQTPIYQASTSLLINEAPSARSNEYAELLTSERLASTYAELIVKRPVLDGVIDRLGLEMSAAALNRSISVAQEEGTQLINVKIQDTDPERAANIANTLGIIFAEQNLILQKSRYAESIRNLEEQLVSADQQIQDTNQALQALLGDTETNGERERLQTELDSYRLLYTDLLQRFVLADFQPQEDVVAGDTRQDLAEQLDEVDALIQTTLADLDVLGPGASNDPERDRLEIYLGIYRQLYNDLLEKFLLAEDQPVVVQTGETKEDLSVQLQQVDALIQTTIADLDALGGGTETDLERDRLETNLALFRQVYASVLTSLELVRLAEIESTSNVVQVEPAAIPSTPISPNVVQDTMLAAVVGLMLAGGIVFLIEALDDTVKGPSEVIRHLGLPVLGYIAEIDQDSGDGPIVARDPRSPLSEAFRALRTNIQYASVDKPMHTILVTSPSPKDGKSTIATNLSIVMAQGGRTVTLIDADLRRPSQHTRMNVSNRMGLSDLFVQENGKLDGAINPTEISGMYLVTSGGLPPNPAELVGSDKMLQILKQVGKYMDMIVLDTPPVMAVTDAAVLAPKVDGVILVMQPGETKLGMAKQTVEMLRRGGANILGVVLNNIEHQRTRYYYYSKGYTSLYESYDSPRKPEKRKRSWRKAPQALGKLFRTKN